MALLSTFFSCSSLFGASALPFIIPSLFIPADNWLQRRMENEADRLACDYLETSEIAGGVRHFAKAALKRKDGAEHLSIIGFMFDSHPPMSQRIRNLESIIQERQKRGQT